MRRGFRFVALLTLVAAVATAGCGGGGAKKESIEQAAIKEHPSLIGGDNATGADNTSAGDSAAYEVTGEVVADNGFRPWVDGFGFENYGNDVGPQNMTPAQMADLFGDEVCESGSGDDCELTPIAQQWMDTENERMGGGHCMGFSVTANQFYNEDRDPAEYGADTPVEIPIQGNVDLQALIAQNWVFQDLPAVADAQVTGTPSEILDELITSLNDEEGELYTIGIFKRDGTGGHAVTPFAVEDKGDDEYAILVYDNNFPGIMRAIQVNTDEDTWSYVGGPDPSDVGQLYEGDADTESMSLFPTSPGLEEQPCFFCSDDGTSGTDQTTGSVGSAAKYDQITLTGDPVNHAHLVLRDDQDRVSGFVDGKLVNNIPGVRIVRPLSSQTWAVAPEPAYLVPQDTAVSVTIDGSGLTKPDKETLTLIGEGLYAEIDEIDVRPGETNTIDFQGGGTGFIFHTDGSHDQTPIMSAAIQEGDNFYVASATAVGVKGGSVLTMYFEKDSGNFAIDTEGTKGGIANTGGLSVYVLSFIRSTPQGDSQWTTSELLIKRGQLALVDYRKAPPKNQKLPIHTATAQGDPTGTQFAAPDND